MKISKCCKGIVYKDCVNSTHWPVIPRVFYECTECGKECQVWELNDCEILLKKDFIEINEKAKSYPLGMSYSAGDWNELTNFQIKKGIK